MNDANLPEMALSLEEQQCELQKIERNLIYHFDHEARDSLTTRRLSSMRVWYTETLSSIPTHALYNNIHPKVGVAICRL